jgi:hypothetical protein
LTTLIPPYPDPPMRYGPKTEESYGDLFLRVIQLMKKVGFKVEIYEILPKLSQLTPDSWLRMSDAERHNCITSGAFVLPKVLAPDDRRCVVPYFDLSLRSNIYDGTARVSIHLSEDQISWLYQTRPTVNICGVLPVSSLTTFHQQYLVDT